MEKIEWSEQSIADLHSIHEHISKDSAFYANKVIDRNAGRIQQLIIFPQSGRIVPELDNEMIRELIEGHYRIVYQLREDSIVIVRIYHSSMSLKNL